MTGTDLVAVVVIGLLIVAMVFMLWRRSRVKPVSRPRTPCAANLSSIAKAMHTYANENEDVWPTIAFDESGEPEPGCSYIEYVNAIRADVSQSPDSLPTKASTTACLWMLVREGMSTPKTFFCPDSDDEPLGVHDPLTMAPEAPNIARNDFETYDNCSYGYQIPFGKLGRPTGGRDPRMPLVADKGPYGYMIETGGDIASLVSALNALDPGRLDSMSADEWRKFNSVNHGGPGDGGGQNVLYTDSHVEWASKPTVGIAGDNIYTRFTAEHQEDPELANRAKGLAPAAGAKYAPMDSKDSMIYP